ncbi:MAG: hypothetical protein WCH83_09645 [Alphaproteobacteria bacterium]
MFTRTTKSLVAGLLIAGSLAATAAPASAGWRRGYGGGGGAVAAGIALGIIGLAGAAIAADSTRRSEEAYYAPRRAYVEPQRYYGEGYAPRHSYQPQGYGYAAPVYDDYGYSQRVGPVPPHWARGDDWRFRNSQ